MFCSACHQENPDNNRFCGQCGAPLREPVHAATVRETASAIGLSSFPSQDVIEQPRRGPDGDAGLTTPDPLGSLSKGGQRNSRPWTTEPLPKEVIDYDNGLPLLAEPGMDRRRQTPEPVRQAMQKVWGNAASISQSETLAQLEPEAPAPEDLWTPPADPVSGAGRNQEAPRHTAFASNGAEAAEDKDLSRFLDFTPPDHDQSGSLSGPSFLGLSVDTELLENEEPQPRKWPRYVAAGVVSALIAAAVVLAVMHWTLVSGVASRVCDAASRYARVGRTYVQTLRAGTTGWFGTNAGPLSAAAAPAVKGKSAPEFSVEQHPAQPAAEAASAAVPKTTEEPLAPESPASTAGRAPLNSTTLSLTGNAGSSDGTGQIQTAKPKQLAAGNSPPVAPKSSDQQFSKPVAGQNEYRQALATNNPELARALLWRATALGNSDAPVRLAEMYIYGQGVPQNCDQGLILLRSAAQKANPQAQGKLGALYATGKCVSQDRVQAYRWLTLALNGARSEWTEENRQMVWREMSPQERSKATSAAR